MKKAFINTASTIPVDGKAELPALSDVDELEQAEISELLEFFNLLDRWDREGRIQ